MKTNIKKTYLKTKRSYVKAYRDLKQRVKLQEFNGGAWISAVIVFSIIALAISPVFSINRIKTFAASTGKCDWWALELSGESYQWMPKTNNGVTSEWCDAKSLPPDRESVYTPESMPDPSITPTPEVVPIIDSKCDWWSLEFNGESYQWNLKTDYGVTEEWCNEKSDPPDRLSAYTPALVPDPTPSPTPDISPAPTPELTPAPETTPLPSVAPEATPTPASTPEATPVPSASPEVIPAPSLSEIPAPAVAGGGVVVVSRPSITSEVKVIVNGTTATITWLTSHFSTSRVIYDTVSGKYDANSASPAFGFAYYKDGDDSGLEKVTFHTVTLTNIVPGTIYYYRTISFGSLIVSSENSFSAPASVSQNNINPIPKPIAPPGLIVVKRNLSLVIPLNVDISIVDYLKSIGQQSDYEYRAGLAVQNGISNYRGTAAQNLRLLALLKKSVLGNY